MKAMIFAAGLGTRFKPWTDKHPKALAVVNGKTLLQRNVEYLQQHGITDVVVNVHHFADQIIHEVEANSGWGSQISISDERDEVLETGGGLKKAEDLLRGEDVFVTINVDILTDLDLSAMIKFHWQEDAFITLGITQRETTRYLLFDKENRLCGWRNTDSGKEKISKRAAEYNQRGYSGIAVFNSRVFELIDQEGKFSLIDVYLSTAPDQKIIGYDHSQSRVLDVGKPESVALAESMFR